MSCGDVYMIDGKRCVLIKVEQVASDFHGEGEKDDDALQRHYAEQAKNPTGKRYHFKNEKGEKMELTEYGMRNAQPTGEHEEVSSCTISGGKKSRRSKKSRGRGSKKSRRSNKKRQSKRTK